jgi:TonB family protein
MKKHFLFVLLYAFSVLAQENAVKTYYPNGSVKSEISFKDTVREGEAKFYFEDGTLKEERLYINGRVEGLVKVYSPNGKLKELINIESGKREGPTSVFDEDGNYIKDIFFENGIQVVQKKNPYIVEEPKKEVAQNNDQQTVVKNSTVKKKKQNYELPPPQEKENLEDDPAIFRTVEVMPEPVGGFESIKKKLIYPDKAKEDGIEGIVEVEVTVDEYGEVIDANVIKGIGYGCDESARIAVYYTKFKPGLQRGKPVKVQITVPVEFKIFDRPEEE